MMLKLRRCLIAALAMVGGSTPAWVSNAWGHVFKDRAGECHKHEALPSYCGGTSGAHAEYLPECGACGVCPGGEELLHFWLPHKENHEVAHKLVDATHMALETCCPAYVCPPPPG